MAKCTGLLVAVTLLVVPSPVEAVGLSFTLLYTGHEAAHYLPHSPACSHLGVGGLPRLATAIADAQREGDAVMVVSAGGPPGTTPFAWLGSQWQRQLMEATGYTVFSDTEGRIRAPMGRVLSQANAVLVDLDHELVVGVVDASSLSPTRGSDQTSLQESLDLLRAEGAGFIILLTHASWQENVRWARAFTSVNLIIGSEAKEAGERSRQVGQTLVVQTVPQLRAAGKVHFHYDEMNGTWHADDASPTYIVLDGTIAPDPLITALTGQALEAVNWWLKGEERLGYGDLFTPVARMECGLWHDKDQLGPMSRFLAHAVRHSAEELTSRAVDGVLLNTASIGGGLYPSAQGTISWYDVLWTTLAYPSPSPILSFQLTGDELHQVLEASLWQQRVGQSAALEVVGLEIDYDPAGSLLFECPLTGYSLPALAAVQQLRWDGAGMVDPDALYHLVSDHATLSVLLAALDELPRLSFWPRNEAGKAVETWDELILRLEEKRDLTLWEATVNYLGNLSRDTRGLPLVVPASAQAESAYRQVGGARRDALFWWVVVVFLAGLIIMVLRLKRHRAQLWGQEFNATIPKESKDGVKEV